MCRVFWGCFLQVHQLPIIIYLALRMLSKLLALWGYAQQARLIWNRKNSKLWQVGCWSWWKIQTGTLFLVSWFVRLDKFRSKLQKIRNPVLADARYWTGMPLAWNDMDTVHLLNAADIYLRDRCEFHELLECKSASLTLPYLNINLKLKMIVKEQSQSRRTKCGAQTRERLQKAWRVERRNLVLGVGALCWSQVCH